MLSRTSTSSSSSDHSKRSLLSCLPTDYKILATASARVYHLPFNARSDIWTYSGLAGILVFGRSRTTVLADRKSGASPGSISDQVYSFRLIDPAKGVVWMHEIPNSFDYALDKPFFHAFSGKSRKFGFRFDDDDEAAVMLKKISTHIHLKNPSPKKTKKFQQLARRLSPGMVSSPAAGTFVHLGHVGFNYKGEIETSDNIEPGWTMMLEELQGYSVTKPHCVDSDGVTDLLAGAKATITVPPGFADQPSAAPTVSETSHRRKSTVKLA